MNLTFYPTDILVTLYTYISYYQTYIQEYLKDPDSTNFNIRHQIEEQTDWPLCRKYHPSRFYNPCKNCPILQYTDKINCIDTPMEKLRLAIFRNNQHHTTILDQFNQSLQKLSTILYLNTTSINNLTTYLPSDLQPLSSTDTKFKTLSKTTLIHSTYISTIVTEKNNSDVYCYYNREKERIEKDLTVMNILDRINVTYTEVENLIEEKK
jgi:hypothetical protein